MSLADLERSETIPKVCIVGAPRHGGHIAVRYFTPQTGHASMAVSGGCCLAAACLLAGSTAHTVAVGLKGISATYSDVEVSIENPAGMLDTTVSVKVDADGIDIRAAAYRRNTQILMRGHVPLYRASAQLIEAMETAAKSVIG
jgi:2-methylaconitate cis-trans-isomerase PrpF